VLSPAAALARILHALEGLAPLPPERIPLADSLGRALAEEIRAPRSLPPFDNSQMDGYALRAADAPGPGARLPVAFEVFAGDIPGRVLPGGACARIFTGAPIPAGADCVEMQEEVARRGRVATFRRAGSPGRFVRPAGADVREGAVALAAGTVVDPGAVGLASALGRTEVQVHRRPRVGVLATGDEIVPVDRPAGPGKILDSNSHAVAAACVEAGAVALLLPIAGDDRGSLARALAAAAGVDALVSTGGVSVGARDHVRAALQEAGARLDFWRVAMRPGKPIAFGLWERTAVFGLPGNPASALVTFEVLVRPALRALAGLPGSGRLSIPARLASPAEKPAALTLFLRCRLRLAGGEAWVEPLATQQSGHLSSVVGVEALAVLPAGTTRLRKGSRVEAILLRPPPLAGPTAPGAPASRRVRAGPRGAPARRRPGAR
jgi:molybdopterin molybdotransferase